MPIKSKDKEFYACDISKEQLVEVRQRKHASLPDMFHLLLHNQTIINDKLNQLLKK